jgi:hypothetical protein
MFDACDPVYYTGGTQCWEMSGTRREGVYAEFIGCVMDAELADPCTEEGDYVVSTCAAGADANACVEADDGCVDMAANCSEIDTAACDAALAAFSSSYRYNVTACFDYYYTLAAETYGPDYEGCSYEYQLCLAGGPAAE